MRKDKNAFEAAYLPIAREIITTLIENLTPTRGYENTEDFPMYSLNSTEGKVLMALIEYSLRRGRILDKSNAEEMWEDDLKQLFEKTLFQRND